MGSSCSERAVSNALLLACLSIPSPRNVWLNSRFCILSNWRKIMKLNRYKSSESAVLFSWTIVFPASVVMYGSNKLVNFVKMILGMLYEDHQDFACVLGISPNLLGLIASRIKIIGTKLSMMKGTIATGQTDGFARYNMWHFNNLWWRYFRHAFLPRSNARLHSTFRILPDDVQSCLLYVIEGVKRCTHSSRIVRNASQTALTASSRESPQLSM